MYELALALLHKKAAELAVDKLTKAFSKLIPDLSRVSREVSKQTREVMRFSKRLETLQKNLSDLIPKIDYQDAAKLFKNVEQPSVGKPPFIG